MQWGQAVNLAKLIVRVCKKGNSKDLVVEKIKTKQKVVNEIETIVNEIKYMNNATKSEKIRKKHELEDKLEQIESEIAEISAYKHAKSINEPFDELTSEDGEFSSIQMWKLKKKLFRNQSEVPTAMLDPLGNVISGKNSLKELYKITYRDRLARKPIKAGWEDLEKMKNYLFEKRMELSSKTKSEPWDIEKVEKVCKN